MKLLYTLLLASMLVGWQPPAVYANVSAPSSEDQLSALECKFLAHRDVRHNAVERLENMERFVYGASRKGTVRDRISALTKSAGASEHPLAKCDTVHDVAILPMSSVMTPEEPPLATLPVQFPLLRKARVVQYLTVADRIEILELNIFGRKECAMRLQLRVARLEQSLVGTICQRPDSTLTSRVNKLWSMMHGVNPDFYNRQDG